MNAKKYFEFFFDQFGYRIKLIKKPKKVLVENSRTRGVTFEMIGPSGIGKTTLHSKASKVLKYNWNLDYLNPNQLQNIKSSSFLDEFYLLSISLIISKFYNDKRGFDENMRLLSFMTGIAKKDRYLKLSGLLDHSGWFLDDSFCHNFTPQVVEIIEKKLISDEILNEFFTGRKFLFLEAPVEYIIKNLQKRRLEIRGALNDYISIYGEESVRKFVQEKQYNCRKLAELSSQFGASSWNLDLLEGIDKNLKRIKEIEVEIIKKRLMNLSKKPCHH